MFGDIVIICLAMGMLILEVKLCLTKRHSLKIKIVCVILLVFLLLSIAMPNIGFINKPFIGEINGVLLDYETNQPISNADVVVRWIVTSAYFPDKSVGTEYKVVISKTDGKGEFRFDKIRKPIFLTVYPIFTRGEVKGGVLPFCENYVFEPSVVESDRNVVLKLKPIKSVHQLETNLEQYSKWTNISQSISLIQVADNYKKIVQKKLSISENNQ
jgi:hypothetical protein